MLQPLLQGGEEKAAYGHRYQRQFTVHLFSGAALDAIPVTQPAEAARTHPHPPLLTACLVRKTTPMVQMGVLCYQL